MTGGLAVKETGTMHQPDPTMLDVFLHATDVTHDFLYWTLEIYTDSSDTRILTG